MKVAVLGATGFIGSWAVRALRERGFEATAIVRPGSDVWRIDGVPDVEIVRSSDWPATFRALRPSVVLSLDWQGVTSADRSDPSVQLSNVARQKALVDAAFSAGVRRFVGTGSQAEYGPVDERIHESRSPAPATPYGHAKVEVARNLTESAAARGAEWIWARVFSVFGPLEGKGWLLPTVANAIAEGRALELSSGRQLWSYLYGPDAGQALAELVANPRASGIYNIGHPVARPLRASVEEFELALGGPSLVTFGSRDGARLEPDTSRLEDLGWAPRHVPADAFAATAAWLSGLKVPDPLVPGRTLPAPR